MHRGEVAQLICRADYAYGARGHPPTIPADATLKFEIELFSWKEVRSTTQTSPAYHQHSIRITTHHSSPASHHQPPTTNHLTPNT